MVGLLAAGAHEDARRVLRYLQSTQEPEGHWPQNMWLDGSPYWSGVQMDETALPIVLVDLARRENAIDGGDLARLWPMVKRAAAYLVRNGPVTQQDRWEVTHLGLPAEFPVFTPAPKTSQTCGPPDEQCQLDPRADLCDDIEPAPADD